MAKTENHSLLERIKKFRKRKILFAFGLLLIAISGMIIPIVPGFLFVILAIGLFRRGWMARIRRYLNE